MARPLIPVLLMALSMPVFATGRFDLPCSVKSPDGNYAATCVRGNTGAEQAIMLSDINGTIIQRIVVEKADDESLIRWVDWIVWEKDNFLRTESAAGRFGTILDMFWVSDDRTRSQHLKRISFAYCDDYALSADYQWVACTSDKDAKLGYVLKIYDMNKNFSEPGIGWEDWKPRIIQLNGINTDDLLKMEFSPNHTSVFLTLSDKKYEVDLGSTCRKKVGVIPDAEMRKMMSSADIEALKKDNALNRNFERKYIYEVCRISPVELGKE